MRTLATRHNLAISRGRAGDAVGATAALTELLGDMVRVLADKAGDVSNRPEGSRSWW